MKYFLLPILAVFFFVSTANNVNAESVPIIKTEIKNAYSYATWGKQKNGVAFFEASHHAPNAKIIAAKADVSDSVELHTHFMEGDKMMMREVENFGFTEGKLKLHPMGDHVMLMGLKNQLNEGESFPLTVVISYENADGTMAEATDEIVVDVKILKAGSKPSDHHGHDHSHAGHSNANHSHHEHKDSDTSANHDHSNSNHIHHDHSHADHTHHGDKKDNDAQDAMKDAVEIGDKPKVPSMEDHSHDDHSHH